MDHVQRHREKYHPVEDVSVTLAHTANGRRVQIIAKRCKAHARLWNSLNEPRQAAAEHVSKCHQIVHGSPNKATDLSRRLAPRGAEMPDEVYHRHWLDYSQWWKNCAADGIDPQPCVYVLAEGGFIRDLHQGSRARLKATEQLLKALDVMADLKGWR